MLHDNPVWVASGATAKVVRYLISYSQNSLLVCQIYGLFKRSAASFAALRMLHGEWCAAAVSADPHSIGFHISALYSPLGWKSWQQIAREWLTAEGSEEMLRAARNTLLGETWVESGDAPEWQRLAERRKAYGGAQIPMGGLFLTAGVDVQKDRVEVDVWAWGRGLESWLVDHIVIAGGLTADPCYGRLRTKGPYKRIWRRTQIAQQNDHRGSFYSLGRIAP